VSEAVKKEVNRRNYTGVVVSDKMDKTIVVEVRTKALHPLYKKYVTKSKKVKAHDAENTAGIGDTVRIEECRKISKDKFFQLETIVERAR
jgi:small subunit ribosomal protein S17